MLWHYSCTEELCPHFVRKNGFGVPKTIGITALFRFCGLFPLDTFKVVSTISGVRESKILFILCVDIYIIPCFLIFCGQNEVTSFRKKDYLESVNLRKYSLVFTVIAMNGFLLRMCSI